MSSHSSDDSNEEYDEFCCRARMEYLLTESGKEISGERSTLITNDLGNDWRYEAYVTQIHPSEDGSTFNVETDVSGSAVWHETTFAITPMTARELFVHVAVHCSAGGRLIRDKHLTTHPYGTLALNAPFPGSVHDTEHERGPSLLYKRNVSIEAIESPPAGQNHDSDRYISAKLKKLGNPNKDASGHLFYVWQQSEDEGTVVCVSLDALVRSMTHEVTTGVVSSFDSYRRYSEPLFSEVVERLRYLNLWISAGINCVQRSAQPVDSPTILLCLSKFVVDLLFGYSFCDTRPILGSGIVLVELDTSALPSGETASERKERECTVNRTHELFYGAKRGSDLRNGERVRVTGPMPKTPWLCACARVDEPGLYSACLTEQSVKDVYVCTDKRLVRAPPTLTQAKAFIDGVFSLSCDDDPDVGDSDSVCIGFSNDQKLVETLEFCERLTKLLNELL